MRGFDHGDLPASVAPKIRDCGKRKPAVRQPERRGRGTLFKLAINHVIDRHGSACRNVGANGNDFIAAITV